MKNMLEYQVCVIYQDIMLLVFYWDSHAFSLTKYKDYLASYSLYFKSKHHLIFLGRKKITNNTTTKIDRWHNLFNQKKWCHNINAFSFKETVLTSYNNLVKRNFFIIITPATLNYISF